MRRKGFTVIELLVVIGIIGALVALLLPVISKLKKSAYAASTGQTINTLTAAINAYQAVFQAYPGPFDYGKPAASRYTIDNPSGADPHLKNGVADIEPTSAESLVLGLSGGFNIAIVGGNVTTFEYLASKVGNGPVSLNGRRPRQYQVFVDAGSKLSNPSQVPNYTNTVVPEFLDAFPDQLPILYARAYRGATGTIAQYPDTDFGYGFNSSFGFGKDFNSAQDYYGDPSFNMLEPRQKDQFILISAGADGKYGTKDDITNFGPPGK